jgi:hypothetical protein
VAIGNKVDGGCGDWLTGYCCEEYGLYHFEECPEVNLIRKTTQRAIVEGAHRDMVEDFQMRRSKTNCSRSEERHGNIGTGLYHLPTYDVVPREFANLLSFML